MKGIFISFEGLDGCGKSRQMQFFSEYLQENGYDPVLTREPGGCSISEQIREILLDTKNSRMDAWTEAYLYAAARRQHVEEVIRPALEQGKIVLSDRFLDSSIAYQGAGRELGLSTIAELNMQATRGCMPDFTVFLDCEPEEAHSRKDEDVVPDRVEKSGAQFFSSVREGFLASWKSEPERILRIDASGPKEATRLLVQDALRDRLKEKGLKLA